MLIDNLDSQKWFGLTMMGIGMAYGVHTLIEVAKPPFIAKAYIRFRAQIMERASLG
jgi:hypothetical protein